MKGKSYYKQYGYNRYYKINNYIEIISSLGHVTILGYEDSEDGLKKHQLSDVIDISYKKVHKLIKVLKRTLIDHKKHSNLNFAKTVLPEEEEMEGKRDSLYSFRHEKCIKEFGFGNPMKVKKVDIPTFTQCKRLTELGFNIPTEFFWTDFAYRKKIVHKTQVIDKRHVYPAPRSIELLEFCNNHDTIKKARISYVPDSFGWECSIATATKSYQKTRCKNIIYSLAELIIECLTKEGVKNNGN
jgi:hypothetical protein